MSLYSKLNPGISSILPPVSRNLTSSMRRRASSPMVIVARVSAVRPRRRKWTLESRTPTRSKSHVKSSHVKSSQVKSSQAQHSAVSQSVSPVQQLQHDQACVHRRQSRGPFGPQSHIEHTHPIVPGGINPGRARDSRINHARILVLAGQVAQILKRQKREPNTPIHRVPCRVPFVFESFRLAVSICLKSIWTRTHTLLHI